MKPRHSPALQQVGAVAGIVHVVLFLAIINFSPAIPIPSESLDSIASETEAHSLGIRLGLYLWALLMMALILFCVAVSARLRERGAGDWSRLCLVGAATMAAGLPGSDALTFVRAVDHGVSGDALWMSYPPGPDGYQIAVPAALFLLGAGLSGLTTGALARWQSWTALALASAFTLGGAGITGDEVDGGPVGALLVLCFVGLWVWTIAVSVRMLRIPVPTVKERPEGVTRG